MVPVSVSSIKGRTFTGTDLRLRQQPNSVQVVIVRCLRQQLLNKGGYCYNVVFSRTAWLDLVPS